MSRYIYFKSAPFIDVCVAENIISFGTDKTDSIEQRTTTVGTALHHFKVKLVDSEGITVPVGVPGEVWTAGYTVMEGQLSPTNEFTVAVGLNTSEAYATAPPRIQGV